MTGTSRTPEEILYHVKGHIAWITFNRPKQLNAMTRAMEATLTGIFRGLNSDPQIRAVILSGSTGQKPTFMAGADMGDLGDVSSMEMAMQLERTAEDLIIALEAVRVPTIAAISGACVGMGALIAAACDVRVVSGSARFGFPIARTVGNCLSAINFRRLVALFGMARTKEMIFSARLLPGRDLVAMGAARELVEDEAAFAARVEEIAEETSRLAPLTLWGTKDSSPDAR